VRHHRHQRRCTWCYQAPFVSLLPCGEGEEWFYKDKAAMKTWSKCSAVFLAKFFPVGKTNAL
jgi:Zn-finger protein